MAADNCIPVEERILAVAERREALLGIIGSTEHVATSLAQAQRDATTLSSKYFDIDNAYGEFLETFKTQQKEFEDIRGSRFRKLFGASSYPEKLKKEEEDLDRATQVIEKLVASRKKVKATLEATHQKRDELKKLKEQRTSALAELDRLYDTLFGGKTAGHEGEDALERVQQVLEEEWRTAQIPVSRAASVVNFIWLARTSIDHAAPYAGYNSGSGQTNIGTYKNVSTRRRLGWVLPTMIEALQHLVSALKLDPEVRGFVVQETEVEKRVPGSLEHLVNIPMKDWLSQQDFLETAEGVRWAAAVVDEQLRNAEEKAKSLSIHRDETSERLKVAREELQRYRASIFEQTLRNRGEAAPGYEEVMAEGTDAGPAPPYNGLR